MKQATIYLLDDEPDMLSLLSDMLDEIGFSAQCYNTGEDFFEQIIEPDNGALMILDLNMPGMDGIEVMRQLAKMPSPPALILISGHNVGVLHSAEKLGAVHNLKIIASFNKPISLVKFQQLIQSYFSDSRRKPKTKKNNPNRSFSGEELYDAIRSEQLTLCYQPQIDIASEKIIGCEALVRWQHPVKGLIYPDEFITMAEQHGWIGELTEWVIREAVEQELRWKNSGYSIPISINISADNITTLSLPEQISQLLAIKKLNPTMLTLEVTESALMGELATSLDILTRLRLKGIGLSIDDFGTGYSSLSMLHKVPFSELKIDRSFVSSMLADEEARAIVKTCIMLGHELKMRVVAEGVETIEHFRLLRKLGCDIAQGYFFSRAIKAEKVVNLIM